MGKSSQTFKVNIYPSETLSRNCIGRNTPKLILQGHHCPDTKPRQRHHKKKKAYRPISLMNVDTEILNKILTNQIQQYSKRIIHHNQEGFVPRMQRFFNIHTSIDMMHHFNKLKNKNHRITSIDIEYF